MQTYRVLKTVRENAKVVLDHVASHESGISLSRILKDSKMARLTDDSQFYLNIGNYANRPAIYLLSMKSANRGLFKMGKSSNVLRRWCNYKTSLPLDGDIVIHACLSLPSSFSGGVGSVSMVIGVFESIMKANLRRFSEQLRNTEWFRMGNAQLINLSVAINFLQQILEQLAFGLPTDEFVLHVYNHRLYKQSEKLDKGKYKLNYELYSKNEEKTPLDVAISRISGVEEERVYRFGEFMTMVNKRKLTEGLW
jgi:hypothetical protein